MKKIGKLFVVGMLVVSLFAMTACGAEGSKEQEILTKVSEMAGSVAEKSLAGWRDIILPYLGIDASQLKEMLPGANLEDDDITNEDSGLISKIMKRNKVKFLKVDKEHITYEVSSPDMSHVFQDLIAAKPKSKDAYNQFMDEYVKNAPLVTTELAVTYSFSGGKLNVNFGSKEVANALTGNIFKSYEDLIGSLKK